MMTPKDTDTPEAQPSQDTRFYGRRKGRSFKSGQKTLLTNLLPRVEITEEMAKCISPNFSLKDLLKALSFDHTDYKSIWFEIGFGGGEHIAQRAADNPDIAFIGCEPFINGVCSLLKHINDKNITNIRILPDDCRPLLERLPSNCFEKAFLLFPDPWPKLKHRERRFINPQSLKELTRLFKQGGEFHFASDDPVLLEWSVGHLKADLHFILDYTAPNDSESRPASWPQTRYEQKAIEQGRTCYFYHFTIQK